MGQHDIASVWLSTQAKSDSITGKLLYRATRPSPVYTQHLFNMRRRTAFLKAPVLILLFMTLYYIRRQHAFQHALPSLYISFSDLPASYRVALNASRTQGDELIDFDYPAIFPNPLIPQTIHFIYFANLYHRTDGTPSLPATSRSHAPALCRKYNPSFTITIWNETAAHTFLSLEYPWFVPTYDAYRHPIQRIDALKYFLLLHFGGIYMDLDVACRRPLDPLLGYAAWFPEAKPLGVNNDVMASVPRHPLLVEMTQALQRRNWNLAIPYLTVFWSTGPQFVSDVLRDYWWRRGARVDSNGRRAVEGVG